MPWSGSQPRWFLVVPARDGRDCEARGLLRGGRSTWATAGLRTAERTHRNVRALCLRGWGRLRSDYEAFSETYSPGLGDISGRIVPNANSGFIPMKTTDRFAPPLKRGFFLRRNREDDVAIFLGECCSCFRIARDASVVGCLDSLRASECLLMSGKSKG